MAEESYPELEGIEVTIDDVVYMPGLDAPAAKPHSFAYFISIHNRREAPVRILARKWVVEEEGGEMTVVEGDKVVGETPEIYPGDSFSYNSYHVVKNHASAGGCFFGKDENGEGFFVRIPQFELELPLGL